jgi:hypothetical protein
MHATKFAKYFRLFCQVLCLLLICVTTYQRCLSGHRIEVLLVELGLGVVGLIVDTVLAYAGYPARECCFCSGMTVFAEYKPDQFVVDLNKAVERFSVPSALSNMSKQQRIDQARLELGVEPFFEQDSSPESGEDSGDDEDFAIVLVNNKKRITWPVLKSAGKDQAQRLTTQPVLDGLFGAQLFPKK